MVGKLTVVVLCILLSAATLASQNEMSTVSFATQDGGHIFADLYGKGERGVVLAHGGRFNKESWAKQAQQLAAAGFRVLAIDFRGYGKSRGPGQIDPLSAPLHFDILAAVRYLRGTGAKSVSVVGGSMGGHAAAVASVHAKPAEIDRIVLLAAELGGPPERVKARKLFLFAGDEPRAARLRDQYKQAPDPKSLVVVEGSAHAQFLFETEQAERVMREILQFLSAP